MLRLLWSRYELDRKLRGPKSRCGRCGVGINLVPAGKRIHVIQPVAMQTWTICARVLSEHVRLCHGVWERLSRGAGARLRSAMQRSRDSRAIWREWLSPRTTYREHRLLISAGPALLAINRPHPSPPTPNPPPSVLILRYTNTDRLRVRVN
jgi:hypothetical protein